MADLYGVGCPSCDKEIAAAFKEMPAMPGYLNTVAYEARYDGMSKPWPMPYVDGEHKQHTIATVPGDDGWLLCLHSDPLGIVQTCECSTPPMNVAYELYRGVVEIR